MREGGMGKGEEHAVHRDSAAPPAPDVAETLVYSDGAWTGSVSEPGHDGYQDLVVWQRAMTWVEGVYRLTASFPDDERFGLTSQLRRAAVSVPSNIAEGWGRGMKGETLQFLRYARGSLFEAETQIELARRLGRADASAAAPLLHESDRISRMLLGLSRAIRSRSRERSR